MNALRSQKGMSFVVVLGALLIAAFLYFGYFKMQDAGGEKSKGIAAINGGREVACRTQRQNVERDIVMWRVNHPDEEASIAALRSEGIRIPACPEGGVYSISGESVHCSKHG
ncbi:MAG: hypothetical protein HY270_00920 [Deltaproteobacteria bacterium]|nr:hypothetical protein [Deltaproteobacteria bacterium]